VNRSLQELLDRERLENQRERNVIEHCLANNDVDLISQLKDYNDSLEESVQDASWTEVGLCDEIRQLEGIVDRKNISKISNSLDWERSRNYRLMEGNFRLQ
jgi:hypothetical protein